MLTLRCSKRKLGNDPNNTKWARKTDSYGQRLLRAHGWEPGQYLGAQGAAHAEYHTVASSSHIQVALKDDNLGLGAKRNNGDECTGLDAFQNLLGRLNGKSEEVLESERKLREDVKLSHYVERRLGTTRFVHGGWLVGDELKETRTDEKTGSKPSSNTESAAVLSDETEVSKSDKKARKRKADEEGNEGDPKKTSKKEKKAKKRKMDAQTEAADADDTSVESKAERKRKSKKQKSESGKAEAESLPTPLSEAETSGAEREEKRKEKKGKKSKKDKGERKEKRHRNEASEEKGGDTEANKEERRKKKKQKSEPSSDSDSEKASKALLAVQGSGISTPSGSGCSTPITGSSRYLARSRFIAQKKLAFTDTTALNQVSQVPVSGQSNRH